MMPADSRSIRLVLILAVALRVIVPLSALTVTGDERVFVAPDSTYYLRLAETLAASGRFAGPTGPERFRLPAFPVFLSIGVALGSPILVTISLQILLGVLTVFLVYLTSRLVWDRSAATWSALAVAVDPGHIIFGSLLMTETLMAAAIALTMYSMVQYLRQEDLRWLVAAVGGMAIAAYTKAVGYFLPLWMAGSLIVVLWRRGASTRRILAHTGILIVLSATVLSAWHLRNWVVAGYGGFSTQIHRAIYVSPAAAVIARQEGRPFQEVRAQLLGSQGADVNGADARFEAQLRSTGTAIVGRSPFTYLMIHLRGSLATLLNPGTTETMRLFGGNPGPPGATLGFTTGRLSDTLARLQHLSPLTWIVTLLLGAPLLVLLAAALVAVRHVVGSGPSFLVVSLAAYLLVAAGGPYGNWRFRVPMTPLLAVLAGGPLSRLAVAGRPRQRSLS